MIFFGLTSRLITREWLLQRFARLSVLVMTWLIALILMLPEAQGSKRPTLRIAVASNFAQTLKIITNEFQQNEANISVAIITGSTGKLWAQIRQGAPYDVFLAADSARPRQLEAEKRIIPGTRRTYAIGRLVLFSPKGLDVHEGKGLQTNAYRHLAIANPRLAPYGLAAQTVLKKYTLPPDAKIVYGENVNQVGQFLITGHAELGFISESLFLAIKQQADEPSRAAMRSWRVPEDLHPPIAQQVVRLKDSVVARRFETFLFSKSTAKIIAAHGYSVPK